MDYVVIFVLGALVTLVVQKVIANYMKYHFSPEHEQLVREVSDGFEVFHEPWARIIMNLIARGQIERVSGIYAFFTNYPGHLTPQEVQEIVDQLLRAGYIFEEAGNLSATTKGYGAKKLLRACAMA